jgi:hypothetical protein
MADSFQPWRDDIRPCITCRFWSASTLSPGHVWCLRHEIVMGVPDGCGSHEREPGADDDAESPAVQARRNNAEGATLDIRDLR